MRPLALWGKYYFPGFQRLKNNTSILQCTLIFSSEKCWKKKGCLKFKVIWHLRVKLLQDTIIIPTLETWLTQTTPPAYNTLCYYACIPSKKSSHHTTKFISWNTGNLIFQSAIQTVMRGTFMENLQTLNRFHETLFP